MKELEQQEADLMLGRPETILTTRFFGIPCKWKMSRMTLGKMLQMAKIYARITIDEEGVNSDDEGERLAANYDAIRNNAWLSARVLAIAVNSRLPLWVLQWHFMRSVDAAQLQSFVYRVLLKSNLVNFSNSIFLMNGSRVTKPRKVEEKLKA